MAMRRRVLIAALILVAAAVSVFAWHALGQAEKSARLSDLLHLRRFLLEFAKVEGSYPEELNEAISDEDFRASIDLSNLEYPAAGRPYDHDADRTLFYERAARKYGFVEGWFEIREQGWAFHEGTRVPAARSNSSVANDG